MAVGLKSPDALISIDGIEIATTDANIKYIDRDDMVLFLLREESTVSAVFTLNKYCAAPVVLAKDHLSSNKPRALLINSGNANAGTGSIGLHNAEVCCQLIAEELEIDKEQVLPFSTGVIGEQLPMEEITLGVQTLTKRLCKDNWLAASKAIMTTDTIEKGVSLQCRIDNKDITITGIAKGSGMICPNMATMLSFIATDAPISNEILNSLLDKAIKASFNRITVDGDTSTNDACVLVATGAADIQEITNLDSVQAQEFYQVLEKVCIELACSIIRDGEGATKFVKVEVINSDNEDDASSIAYSVAHSPLVKTALFASDPNWGRILAAIGKAKVDKLDISKICISVNDQILITNGEPDSSYSEEAGKKVFSMEEIHINIDLGLGTSNHHLWTSDLSHDYVSINADYRS